MTAWARNFGIKKTAETVKNLVARDGIEPPTQGFSVPCSTD